MSLSKQEPNKTNKTIGERGKRGRKRGRKWRRRNKKKKKRVDQPLPVWPLVNSGDGKRNGNHIFPVHVFPSHSFGWSIDKFIFFNANINTTNSIKNNNKTTSKEDKISDRRQRCRDRNRRIGNISKGIPMASETRAGHFQGIRESEESILKLTIQISYQVAWTVISNQFIEWSNFPNDSLPVNLGAHKREEHNG